MKQTQFKNLFRRNLYPILACFLPSFAILAQEEPNQADIEELSPFVVETDSNMGYMATSTLAGTRLNTDLKDVGAAVSVYTEEFLQDIGANNIEDILTYTTSTEGGGMFGNFSSIGSEDADAQRDNPSGVNRIRALASASRTRDYFSSGLPTDSYNITTITINRGPNAILAGIGAPGGLIDATLRQATFNDSGSAHLRFGEHSSHREEFHYNKELIKDRLAFRIDALNEDRKFKQDPAFEEDRRVYIAVKANLREANRNAFFGQTQIRANYEVGEIEGTPPNMLPPNFGAQSWFEGIDPESGQPWPAPKWRFNGALRDTYDQDGWQNGNGNEVVDGEFDATVTVAAMFRNWGLVFADPGSDEPTVGLPGDFSSIQGFQGTIPGGRNGPGGGVRATGDVNRNRAGFFRTRLTNPEVFDFYNNLLSGNMDLRQQEFDALDIRLEQLFAGGKAGLEFAYNEQYIERARDFPISGGEGDEIQIDANEFLSIRTDAFNTGGPITDQLIPNPNFGRPFVTTRNLFRDQINTSESEAFQVTGFFQHDFTDSDAGIVRWLGRHTLSGLYFDTSGSSERQTFNSAWDPQGELPAATALAAQPGQFRANVNAWFYIGDSQVNAASADDVRMSPIRTSRPEFGQTYTLRIWDVDQQRFVTGTSSPTRILGNFRQEKEDVNSTALALQSHWLDDHLVTLIGWREDSSDTFTSIDLPRLPDGNRDVSVLELEPASSQSKESWTYSVVGKFPEKYLFDLPLGSDLRVFWNTSENFSPVGQRRNIFNEEVGSPVAETEEYGFLLSTLEGKIDLRVTWFETKINNAGVGVPNPFNIADRFIGRWTNAHIAELDPQAPAANPADPDGLEFVNGDPVSFQSFEEASRALFDMLPDRLKANIGPEFNFNPRFTGTGDTFDWESENIVGRTSLSDIVSEGVEIELVANPTPNWRLALSVAQNEAVQADVAALELEFVDEFLGNVAAFNNGELFRIIRNPVNGPDNQSWLEEANTAFIDQINTEASLSGTTTPEIREWRVNAVTSYRFSDGFLKGFRLGGALRWQDKVGIGFPRTTNDEGVDIADVANPFFGPTETYVDLNVGYRKDFTAFDRELTWNISLNVQNVAGGDELIPISANADSTFGTLRIAPERTWFITNTLNF